MHTRSKSNPNNSNATIPRRQNRRRIPNIVEPEIRTIEEVVSMADRTMKELLQAPTEGYGEAIGVRGMILAAHSEALKQENVLAEWLHGLYQQMERKEDESLYFMDRIWFHWTHVLWAEIEESSLTGLELVQEMNDKVLRGILGDGRDSCSLDAFFVHRCDAAICTLVEEVILLAVELIKFRYEIPLSRGDCDTRDLSRFACGDIGMNNLHFNVKRLLDFVDVFRRQCVVMILILVAARFSASAGFYSPIGLKGIAMVANGWFLGCDQVLDFKGGRKEDE
nr:hypothetical protein [Tanacetum cinerariifolium]